MGDEHIKPGIASSDLLAGLRSSDPSGAWKRFLEIHSSRILSIAAQYEHNPDRANDCCLYVCEKLSDQGFQRLLQYEPEGAASFRSWLKVVVANLCIDWRRHSRGRARPFKAIRSLPRFEQLVFRYRIQQRLSPDACLAAMQPDFPDLTLPELSHAVQRINALLTPRQHYLLSVQKYEAVSLDHAESREEPADAGPGPEKEFRLAQKQERVRIALGELEPAQRLLLRLRYEQELSLKEVARLMRLGDPFRARRQIQSALDALERHLKD